MSTTEGIGDMLEHLHRSEMILPTLLRTEGIWKSVFVNYHKPYVERLWCEWEDFRLYLHRIHPCEDGEALFHPHPWPSAMKIIDGQYEMCLGYALDDTEPIVSERRMIGAGSEYEMTSPHEWHSVRPIETPSMSLMITGTPWKRISSTSRLSLSALAPIQREQIFQLFRSVYL